MDKLPIYKLLINDDPDTGVEYVALVDEPAIEMNWQAFEKHAPFKFEITSEEKRVVSGALMVADLPIYRRDNSGEFYVLFERKTIYKIVQKYFKNGFTSNVNLMHDPYQKAEGVYMFESFIIDRERGVMPPKAFENITDGSWFGSYKVENDQVWKLIKEGQFKGFSVEGFFDNKYVKDEDEEAIERIIEIIKK